MRLRDIPVSADLIPAMELRNKEVFAVISIFLSYRWSRVSNLDDLMSMSDEALQSHLAWRQSMARKWRQIDGQFKENAYHVVITSYRFKNGPEALRILGDE